MADDDDIEALLREIDQMNAAGESPAGGAVVPAKEGKEPATTEDGRSPRFMWTLVAAVGCGGAGFVVGLLLAFLPLISPLSTAVGAALGGAIAAAVGGPPKWWRA